MLPKRHEPVDPRVKSDWLHLTVSVIRFYDKKAYCAFFRAFFSEKIQKKEVIPMKKQRELELVAIGHPDIFELSESEQRNFYITLLTRILELYKEKKEREEV